jgi:hypothetical protein
VLRRQGRVHRVLRLDRLAVLEVLLDLGRQRLALERGLVLLFGLVFGD